MKYFALLLLLASCSQTSPKKVEPIPAVGTDSLMEITGKIGKVDETDKLQDSILEVIELAGQADTYRNISYQYEIKYYQTGKERFRDSALKYDDLKVKAVKKYNSYIRAFQNKYKQP